MTGAGLDAAQESRIDGVTRRYGPWQTLLDTFRRCRAKDADGNRCIRVRNHDGMWHINENDDRWTGAP